MMFLKICIYFDYKYYTPNPIQLYLYKFPRNMEHINKYSQQETPGLVFFYPPSPGSREDA